MKRKAKINIIQVVLLDGRHKHYQRKFLHDKHTEMGFTPVSHIVSRISFRLSDITVVKPGNNKNNYTKKQGK
jgi:hypothetical protein